MAPAPPRNMIVADAMVVSLSPILSQRARGTGSACGATFTATFRGGTEQSIGRTTNDTGILASTLLLVPLDYDHSEMAGPPFSVSKPEVQALLGKRFEIRNLGEIDIWAENPRFQQRGLSRLSENIYGLRPRAR